MEVMEAEVNNKVNIDNYENNCLNHNESGISLFANIMVPFI